MNRRDLLRLLAFSGLSLSNVGTMASFFSACARRPFARPTIRSDKYGLTILVDGLRADMFQEMLDAGELPNIKTHLVDRGTMVRNCVGTFPSTTGPAHLPFINGAMPGHNNCPGLRWVDRSHQRVRDYCTMESTLFDSDFPRPNYTIYEMLTGERTTCIFDFASRGAVEKIRPPIKTLWFVLSGNMKAWERIDQDAVDVFEKIYLGGGPTPRYSLIWMPAVDHLSHFHGSLSAEVHERARGVDRQVGTLMGVLQKTRLYERTIVSLVADHGLRDTSNNSDIRETLRGYGLKVLDNLFSNDSFNSLYQHNAVRGVSGNGFALLYLATWERMRGGTGRYAWDRPVKSDELRAFPVEGEGRLDLIQLLRDEKPVKLVIVKEKEDVYLVFSKRGEGKIERDYASFRYTVNGPDPLGYADHPESARLIDGAYHDKDLWFSATTGTHHPDALFQVSQLFDSDRCGDIVLSSEPGWDLMKQGHVASHGGLEKAEMMVPCVIAGPGIKQGVIAHARSVDLYPTYLKYLGIPNYDGEVLNVFL